MNNRQNFYKSTLIFFIVLNALTGGISAQNRTESKAVLYYSKNTFIFLEQDNAILEILVIDKPNYFINLDTLVKIHDGNYKGRYTNIQMKDNQYSITEIPKIPNFKRKAKVPIKLKRADADAIAKYRKYKDNPYTKLYKPE